MLNVHIEDLPEGVSVVALTGELDVGTVRRMEGALMEQILQRPGVLIDLGGLTFIDSSGIGALIQACRGANGTPVKVVVGEGTQVARVFEIAGVGEAVDVFTDREEALAALAAMVGRANADSGD